MSSTSSWPRSPRADPPVRRRSERQQEHADPRVRAAALLRLGERYRARAESRALLLRCVSCVYDSIDRTAEMVFTLCGLMPRAMTRRARRLADLERELQEEVLFLPAAAARAEQLAVEVLEVCDAR